MYTDKARRYHRRQNGNGTLTIDRCRYSGTLTVNGNVTGNFGGIIGLTYNGTGATVNISNCLFDGTIDDGTGDNAGGIVGYTNRTKVTIKNCLSKGTITATKPGLFFGQLNASNSKWDGVNYYVTTGSITGNIQNSATLSGTAPTQATSTQLTSGELCILLNNNEDHGTNWYQTLGTDNYPTPNGSDLVYKYDSYDDCAMTTPTTGTISYTNTPISPAHTYTDGICSTCNYINPNYASKNSEGYYEIGTPSQLKWFAAWVNQGGDNMSANAKLTADIPLTSWPDPIGNWSNSIAYKGHFDGQGFTIGDVNFSYTTAKDYHGIFGIISTGALVENFNVYGTINNAHSSTVGVVAYARDATPTIRNVHSYLIINNTVTGAKLGGVLGTARNGTVIVDRCTYSGTLDGNDAENNGNYGGIVAYSYNHTNTTITVTNCLFDGVLKNTAATPGDCSFGGIFGFVGGSSSTTIQKCLSVGSVGSTIRGMICGKVTGTQTIENNYYKDGEVGANGSGDYPATAVSTEQLASGEVAYLLNGSVSGGTDWYQTLPSTDAFPYPYSTHGHVYVNGTVCPDTGTPQGTVSYGNTEGTTVGSHHPVDGFCTYCGTVDDNYMTPIDGYYMIGTPAQLKWFAAFVNAGHQSANAKLANITPLDMTGVAIEPIGNSSAAYTGTFDGQGKSIMGFSATSTGNGGLFGNINNATIKDFSIDGVLDVTGGTASGVIGYSKGSIISGIHSSLTITTSAGTAVGHVGGVVGSLNQNDNVSGCSFSGSITVNANSHNCFGGIVGYMTSNDKIQNCANYGSITYSKNNCYAGGIEGYINATSASIQNCLSTGAVTYVGEGTATYGGAIVGYMKSTYVSSNFSDNYWLGGSAAKAYGGKTDEANEADATQLASGEVAYKLGSAWYQTIGTDRNPVLDSNSEKVLYVGAAGYSTFYDADYGWALSSYKDEAKAFIGTINGCALHLEEIDDIPAGTAVVISGTYYNKVSTTATANTTVNVLKGSKGSVTGGDGIYALAIKNDKVGFYPVAANVTIPAGKTYLEYTGTGGGTVKGFTFVFDEDDPTGIEDLKDSKDLKDSNVIYNIAGQRISKMQRGINIVNGKKVLK